MPEVLGEQALPCGCHFNPEKDYKGPVYWNAYNHIVQCHKCGRPYELVE
jgi:hypothetical protein